MRERNVSVAEAKEILIQEIHRRIEDEVLELQQQFYDDESNEAKRETARYFSALHLVLSGNALWHLDKSSIPDHPFYPKPEHKLADMRRDAFIDDTTSGMHCGQVNKVEANGVIKSTSSYERAPKGM
ncbi:hypothetical protein TWF696_004082 [Orbilia brochopaga]|uniref:Uncharacterized protein n=1 Tax=Orbilia brochopaga TaxID=3140254 RepID=A0AAV9V829_9PEZI